MCPHGCFFVGNEVVRVRNSWTGVESGLHFSDLIQLEVDNSSAPSSLQRLTPANNSRGPMFASQQSANSSLGPLLASQPPANSSLGPRLASQRTPVNDLSPRSIPRRSEFSSRFRSPASVRALALRPSEVDYLVTK